MSPVTFDQAYRSYRKDVTRFITWRCGYSDDVASAEDAAQETFFVAWRHWSTRTSTNVKAWLFGIAKFVALRLRRSASGMRPFQPATSGEAEPAVVSYDPDLDKRSSPATQELSAMVRQLREKFSGLGPVQQIALNGVAAGLEPQDIAERAGISAASLRMALSLGRRRLREMTDAAPSINQ